MASQSDHAIDIMSHIAFVGLHYYGEYLPTTLYESITDEVSKYTQEHGGSSAYETFCCLLNKRLLETTPPID